jgi:hypothetical protein
MALLQGAFLIGSRLSAGIQLAFTASANLAMSRQPLQQSHAGGVVDGGQVRGCPRCTTHGHMISERGERWLDRRLAQPIPA